MNVVICWSHLSGYMAACWRALAEAPGVSVFVIAFESDAANPFDARLLAGIPHRLLDPTERHDAALIRGIVAGQAADLILVGGWNHVAYRRVVADPAVAAVPKVLCIDTPLRNDWRQFVGRRLLRSYLRRFVRVAVPGARAAAYAKYLGFADANIRLGLYGIDYPVFSGCLERRIAAGPWPRKFLYVGRYAPEKGIDVLAAGYARYRVEAGADAWQLVCCGRGPEQEKLKATGVVDLGFVPPDRQADVFADAGAFVIASGYEPWGVAIAEAAAAGLPLVSSDACGATAELLRDGVNGFSFRTGDPAMLAQQLLRVTAIDGPQWGGRSRALAAAYSAVGWPQRVLADLLPASAGRA